MALKVLMLRHKLDKLRAAHAELEERDAEFTQRESELAASIDEASSEEEQTAVDAAIDQYEEDKDAHEAEKERLATEISDLEAQLAAEEKNQTPPPADPEANKTRKEERKGMEYITRFKDMTHEQRTLFVEREDMRDFLSRVRSMGAQNRAVTGADLTIPEVMLGLIRAEVAENSKLLKYVRVANVSGTTRQPIMGSIPEAIWTEMCGKLNELALRFNQVTVDAYKVGGFVAICNAALEDSDINLAAEILSVISAAIAKALDKAILFGSGTKMPIGIATRLAQTAAPDSWDPQMGDWTDLHESNIRKIDKAAANGVDFFAALVTELSIAKPKYSSEGLFWVMNRKTHIALKTKMLSFNAAGALVAGEDKFPIVGGDIIEFEDEDIADNEIIGGYGANYLLAQREGATFGQSEHARFLEEQTVFKGTARYDGMPVAGEAFVVVNYSNIAPTTGGTFERDYANDTLNQLTVTAAAGAAAGATVLTVGNTLAEGSAVLKYKVKATAENIKMGDTLKNGWSDLTSGTTQITAAAGVNIAVVELDDNNRVVSVGQVIAVPKA